MRRRRRYAGDPFALATQTTKIVTADFTGTCPKCLTDYPAGALIIHGRHGWHHALCDERDE